jgi:WD40 repeat protein
MRRLSSGMVALALAVCGAAPARAQYFGQNKVQYRSFHWQVIETEHFDVYFYSREREAALDAARMAERSYTRLSSVLHHQFKERKPIILYASPSDFTQTNTTTGNLGEGIGGFTDVLKHRMVLPFPGAYADLRHVIQHEMVHQFQFDVFSHGEIGGGIEALNSVAPPLWFMEGMAEYLSLGPPDPLTTMWLRDAALEGGLPTIEQLTTDPRIFPYRFGHAIFAYIGEKWGDEAIGEILQDTPSMGVAGAFRRVLGRSLGELSDEWRDAIQSIFLPQLADHYRAHHIAKELLTPRRAGGSFHLAPALSPDGKEIAFLGERNSFFIDLYLANAQTGHVERRLIKSTINSNYESLRFINSSGSFSPDGEDFAIAVKHKDRDDIVLLDVPHDREIGRIRLPLDGAANPVWSPDGRQLAFTGFAGGLTDLYIVNRDGSDLRRLTNDRYAELNPAWSPDGKTIAFTTDRGPETDFSILRFGNMRIALYHLDTGRIEVLNHMDFGLNHDAAWAPDGKSLAFVSDRTGIANIFLYDFADHNIYQLTNVYTGVSGITPISPCLSWARKADRLAFAYFEDGDYDVYTVDNPRSLRRAPYHDTGPLPVVSLLAQVTDSGPAPIAATGDDSAQSVYRSASGLRSSAATPTAADTLGDRPPVSMRALLDSATLPLPDTASFSIHPYHTRFTTDFVARPTIGYERDNFGRGIFGGTSIELSDLLGNQTLVFSGAVNGSISEAQVLAAYINQGHRWNYDLGVQQQPLFYYTGSSYIAGAGPGGTDIWAQQIERLVFRQAFGDLYYPFNRFRRLEFGLRYTNVGQATLNLLTVVDPTTQLPTGEYADSTATGPSLNLVQPSVALVFDNSLFGYTSAFFGKRYRFEVAPVFGDWHYVQVLADYRRYDLIKFPFTFATRFLMLGRFGRDGDLFPVYMGTTDLVRGYTFGSYSLSSCTAPTAAISSVTGCPELDQLLGSRIAVFNAEFRFQLVRNLTLGFLPVGFPPIEGALWYDAGIAWNSGSQVRWSRPASADPNLVRVPLTSYGFGLRVNLLGLTVLRLDYAIPNQRPGHGGYWLVSLGPPF